MLQTANASRRHYRAHTRSARVRDRPARERGANFIRRYKKARLFAWLPTPHRVGGGIRTIGQTVKKPTDPTKYKRNPKRTYNDDQEINKIVHT